MILPQCRKISQKLSYFAKCRRMFSFEKRNFAKFREIMQICFTKLRNKNFAKCCSEKFSWPSYRYIDVASFYRQLNVTGRIDEYDPEIYDRYDRNLKYSPHKNVWLAKVYLCKRTTNLEIYGQNAWTLVCYNPCLQGTSNVRHFLEK